MFSGSNTYGLFRVLRRLGRLGDVLFNFQLAKLSQLLQKVVYVVLIIGKIIRVYFTILRYYTKKNSLEHDARQIAEKWTTHICIEFFKTQK